MDTKKLKKLAELVHVCEVRMTRTPSLQSEQFHKGALWALHQAQLVELDDDSGIEQVRTIEALFQEGRRK